MNRYGSDIINNNDDAGCTTNDSIVRIQLSSIESDSDATWNPEREDTLLANPKPSKRRTLRYFRDMLTANPNRYEHYKDIMVGHQSTPKNSRLPLSQQHRRSFSMRFSQAKATSNNNTLRRMSLTHSSSSTTRNSNIVSLFSRCSLKSNKISCDDDNVECSRCPCNSDVTNAIHLTDETIQQLELLVAQAEAQEDTDDDVDETIRTSTDIANEVEPLSLILSSVKTENPTGISTSVCGASNPIGKILVSPIDCRFGFVSDKISTASTNSYCTLRRAILRELNSKFGRRRNSTNQTSHLQHTSYANNDLVMIVYVIRNPGCQFCYQYGIQLTTLAKQFQNVTCIGVIKDIHIKKKSHHNDILDLYHEAFTYPYYRDTMSTDHVSGGRRKSGNHTSVTSSVYETLGNRVVSSSGIVTRKNSRSGFINEQVLGGVMIFDKDAILRYTYHEIYHEEQLDIDVLRQAIHHAQRQWSFLLPRSLNNEVRTNDTS
jgi:hypothetical protein